MVKRKARIIQLAESETGILVYTKVELDEGEIPDIGSSVTVTPKPIKYAYKSTRQVINKFSKTPDEYKGMYAIINSTPIEDTDDELLNKRKNLAWNGKDRKNVKRMRCLLNEKQVG